MTKKDTNSQDSIQVGNESIQTNTLEKISQKWDKQAQELHEYGEIQNTLGTTMEETLKEEFQNVWFTNGLDPEHFERVKNEISNWWLEKLSQSKTDLLNALIDREEGELEHYWVSTDNSESREELLNQLGKEAYNQAKTDTINHLKSLRDELSTERIDK